MSNAYSLFEDSRSVFFVGGEKMQAVIRDAVEKGDTSKIQRILKGGANTSVKDRLGWIALMHAVNQNRPELAKLIIDAGADINDRDILTGETPLWIALNQGQNEVAELLIEAGADVNVQDLEDGMSPLMLASNAEMVDLLLCAGARVNVSNLDGDTVLMVFSKTPDAEKIVAALLEAGANVDVRDAEGNTPLMLASLDGHAKTVELLLNKRAKIDVKNDDGETALDIARREGHEDIVQLLLQASKPKKPSSEGTEVPEFVRALMKLASGESATSRR